MATPINADRESKAGEAGQFPSSGGGSSPAAPVNGPNNAAGAAPVNVNAGGDPWNRILTKFKKNLENNQESAVAPKNEALRNANLSAVKLSVGEEKTPGDNLVTDVQAVFNAGQPVQSAPDRETILKWKARTPAFSYDVPKDDPSVFKKAKGDKQAEPTDDDLKAAADEINKKKLHDWLVEQDDLDAQEKQLTTLLKNAKDDTGEQAFQFKKEHYDQASQFMGAAALALEEEKKNSSYQLVYSQYDQNGKETHAYTRTFTDDGQGGGTYGYRASNVPSNFIWSSKDDLTNISQTLIANGLEDGVVLSTVRCKNQRAAIDVAAEMIILGFKKPELDTRYSSEAETYSLNYKIEKLVFEKSEALWKEMQKNPESGLAKEVIGRFPELVTVLNSDLKTAAGLKNPMVSAALQAAAEIKFMARRAERPNLVRKYCANRLEAEQKKLEKIEKSKDFKPAWQKSDAQVVAQEYGGQSPQPQDDKVKKLTPDEEKERRDLSKWMKRKTPEEAKRLDALNTQERTYKLKVKYEEQKKGVELAQKSLDKVADGSKDPKSLENFQKNFNAAPRSAFDARHFSAYKDNELNNRGESERPVRSVHKASKP